MSNDKDEANDSSIQNGRTLNSSAGRIRNYEGYCQSLEEYEETDKNGNFKNVKRWVFNVTGLDATFSGEAGYCHVLKFDGSEERVSIDTKDRILINGRYFSRKYWNH